MSKTKSKEYSRCHAAIHRKHGKANKCENPGCANTSPKRFEWALRHGRSYSTDINDYLQLCPSCHRLYDFTAEHRKNMSLSSPKKRPWRVGVNHEKSKPVDQFDLDGNYIKTWESVNQAAIGIGLIKQSILKCLHGQMKRTQGYTFKWYNSTLK